MVAPPGAGGKPRPPRREYPYGGRLMLHAKSRAQRTGTMPPPKKTRDLARRLVAREADASATSPHTQPAAVRVYEKLRRQLGASVGTDGFQALASRALALAKSESPRLGAVQLTADGGLRGLGAAQFRTGSDEEGEVGIILIAELLGLFLAFLGAATTLRLIEDLRLQVAVEAEAPTTPGDTAAPAADGPEMAAAFGDLLRDIDRLRSVGDHIEAMANQHTDMELGLVSAAGNIRSIATVLDVFVLIRSKAGGSLGEAPLPPTNGYMN